MKLVKDDGTGRERIIVIGEMPGAQEVALGKPFVGPSGHKLASWLRAVGLERKDIYWSNVVPYRHNLKNDVAQIPAAELATWIDQLHDRLAALRDPWLIVPTGNTALRALVGKSSITKHRGSIYGYQDRQGRTVKVIPTIHPAALFRQPSWERRCLADWHRIRGDAAFRDLRLPDREHFIRPTLADCRGYLDDAQSQASVMVVDVETPRQLQLTQTLTKRGKVRTTKRLGTSRITCVGFSFDPAFSFTIPTTESYWGSPEALADAWEVIRELCSLPTVEYGGQNFLFDRWWLAQHGINLAYAMWDSRWLSHCADPLDAHDLGYQASIYTREPYFKDDTKEKSEDAAEPSAEGLETFWTYNGKDCAVTRELIDVHVARLTTLGKLKFYHRFYAQMFDPLLAMSLGGMRMDERQRKLKLARFLGESIGIQDKLKALSGRELYGAKGSLSFKKLQEYLYGDLKLPAQKDRATGGVTTREVAVRKLMLRFPGKLGKDGDNEMPGPLILRHRRLEALRRFTKDGIADEDGYARSQFGFVDTLRLRSGKNPRRTGNNSQNTDRDLLDLYLPDPGHVFLEVDLSQAEDRVVKMLTRAPRLIERARAAPWENDEHRRAAAIIYHTTPELVTTKPSGGQRYIGKRARHAGNYGLGGNKFSEELLKEGIVVTPDEAGGWIGLVLDKDTPEVRDWQREVRQRVLRDKIVTNTWGWSWDVSVERMGDELFRSCYAFQPQSEVVMLVNEWGFKPLYDFLIDVKIPARVVNQKHDSLLISTPPEHAWVIACFLKASLERPRTYAGNELTIPCEFKLGRTAAMDCEFKRFPSRREFDEVAHGLVA